MNNSEFEKTIQYTFKDKNLLNKALTHSSFSREHSASSKDNNERLEFLGDAFFDAVISVKLYRRLEKVDEGRLTKTRALIVCEKSLAEVAKRLRIGEHLNMGRGEELSGGRRFIGLSAGNSERLWKMLLPEGCLQIIKPRCRKFCRREEERPAFHIILTEKKVRTMIKPSMYIWSATAEHWETDAERARKRPSRRLQRRPF